MAIGETQRCCNQARYVEGSTLCVGHSFDWSSDAVVWWIDRRESCRKLAGKFRRRGVYRNFFDFWWTFSGICRNSRRPGGTISTVFKVFPGGREFRWPGRSRRNYYKYGLRHIPFLKNNLRRIPFWHNVPFARKLLKHRFTECHITKLVLYIFIPSKQF